MKISKSFKIRVNIFTISREKKNVTTYPKAWVSCYTTWGKLLHFSITILSRQFRLSDTWCNVCLCLRGYMIVCACMNHCVCCLCVVLFVCALVKGRLCILISTDVMKDIMLTALPCNNVYILCISESNLMKQVIRLHFKPILKPSHIL